MLPLSGGKYLRENGETRVESKSDQSSSRKQNAIVRGAIANALRQFSKVRRSLVASHRKSLPWTAYVHTTRSLRSSPLLVTPTAAGG